MMNISIFIFLLMPFCRNPQNSFSKLLFITNETRRKSVSITLTWLSLAEKKYIFCFYTKIYFLTINPTCRRTISS